MFIMNPVLLHGPSSLLSGVEPLINDQSQNMDAILG